MKKRVITQKLVFVLLFSLCLVFTSVSAAAGEMAEQEDSCIMLAADADIIDQGVDENGCFWILDSGGVLTISGKGPMEDYTYYISPWKDYTEIIRSVVIEEGITSIGTYAFSDCINLQTVSLPEGLTDAGAWTFFGCKGLLDVVIPESVKQLSIGLFEQCASLKTLTITACDCEIDGEDSFIPSTTILSCYKGSKAEAYAFQYGRRLHYLDDGSDYTPDSYKPDSDTPDEITPETEAAASGFVNEKIRWSLSEGGVLRLSGSGKMPLDNYGEADEWNWIPWFYHKNSIQKVIVEDGITSIATAAFSNAVNLKEVELPDSIKEICPRAFKDCISLTAVTLPQKLVVLDYSAFENCTGLKEMEIPGKTVFLGVNAFTGCTALEKITVPASVTEIGGYGKVVFTGCDKLTIYGYGGSAIENYAASYNIPFVSIGEVPVDENLTGLMPTGETPGGGTPAGETPTEETPVQNVPAVPVQKPAVTHTQTPAVKKASSVRLQAKTVIYNGRPVTVTPAKVTGSSGKISYTYYLNAACTKKTTKKNSGAVKNGGAPKTPGVYYVKAAVKADRSYKAGVSKPVKLTIKPKVKFSWKKYEGYYFLYPKITGWAGIKSYHVELYNGSGKKPLRITDEYFEPMKFGMRPDNGSTAASKFQKGKKYKARVIFTMTNGKTMAVESKYMKFSGR